MRGEPHDVAHLEPTSAQAPALVAEPTPEEGTPDSGAPQTVEPAPPTDPTPVLVDAEGTALGQTEERPTADSRAFAAGVARLFEAIVADDAAIAMPFFFPKIAYEQVKDIQNPGRDWEARLVRLFERDIHAYHRRLGARRRECKPSRIVVPETGVKWMTPGSEGNRVGYFRVLRSTLYYLDPDGKERQLGITSFISWRGEWYVVHLAGFK